MKELGFEQGSASPCVFWDPHRDINALVHNAISFHPAKDHSFGGCARTCRKGSIQI